MPYAWYGVDAPAYGSPPEYIQLSRQMDGVYRFYTGVGPTTAEGTELVVRLFIDGALVQELTWFPSITYLGGGDFVGDNVWLAFELTGSTVTVLDTPFECRADNLEDWVACFD